MKNSVYSRENPSKLYIELRDMYIHMHKEGFDREVNGEMTRIAPQNAYPGNELPNHINQIKALIDKLQIKSVMDYGSGKALNYARSVMDKNSNVIANSIPEYWGIDTLICYDVGVEEFKTFPEGQFDCVISTDVLEHIPQSDLYWTVEELFSKATKAVFCNVACYPASARLPNGLNAHVTVKSPHWWIGVFDTVQSKYPDVSYSLGLVGTRPDLLDNPKTELVYFNKIVEA